MLSHVSSHSSCKYFACKYSYKLSMKCGSLKPYLVLLIRCMYYGMFSSLTAYSMFEGTSIVSSSNAPLDKTFCWLFYSSLEYCFTSCIILWKYCLALAIVSFPNLGKKKPQNPVIFNLTLLITLIRLSFFRLFDVKNAFFHCRTWVNSSFWRV